MIFQSDILNLLSINKDYLTFYIENQQVQIVILVNILLIIIIILYVRLVSVSNKCNQILIQQYKNELKIEDIEVELLDLKLKTKKKGIYTVSYFSHDEPSVKFQKTSTRYLLKNKTLRRGF